VFSRVFSETRRSNYKVPFHHYIFTSWVPHNSSLGFKDFFHLVCLSICLRTSKAISYSGSYLMTTTCGILWVAQLVVLLSSCFTHGLEPKVPDCAGFQYMKLAFNPRSILLKPCVNGFIITQYGLPFNLVVVVVIELRQQRTFPSTSYGRCSLMEPKWITTRVLFVSLISMSLTLPHPPFQPWFTWDVNLCIQIQGFLLRVFLLLSCFPTLVCQLVAKL
jgi:hypothetical protein